MTAKTEHEDLKGFYLTGISVRTTNQNGQSQKDIGALLTRFMSEGLLQQIDGRLSDDIYCVYTDYETDHTGFYTAVLGCKVISLNHIPDGFTGIAIPAGKYQVYFLEGKFPDNFGAAWQEIWNSGIDRAYTADFDLYSTNPKSFEETEAKIYLAVK
jgi:predicted transcriptional regulator YdeE